MTKEAVLGAIRRGLRRGELPADQQAMLRARLDRPPRQLIPARSQVPRPEQVLLFVRNVEKEFGTVARVPGADAVPASVAEYLAGQNLPPRFVMAPHPELQAIPWASRPLLDIRQGRAEATDLVSVQQAFAAVAETGTLMLPSAPVRPTTVNLLPDTAIVVLRASRIVGPYEDAWALLRQEPPQPSRGFMPRNVMLVTGPSRSADIEQTLELGAHGPRRLHIVLIDDDPAALPPQQEVDGFGRSSLGRSVLDTVGEAALVDKRATEAVTPAVAEAVEGTTGPAEAEPRGPPDPS